MVGDRIATSEHQPAELRKLSLLFSQQAVWPSAFCDWTATSTSPLPTATTPAIRSGR
jgi:hypothetical protein